MAASKKHKPNMRAVCLFMDSILSYPPPITENWGDQKRRKRTTLTTPNIVNRARLKRPVRLEPKMTA